MVPHLWADGLCPLLLVRGDGTSLLCRWTASYKAGSVVMVPHSWADGLRLARHVRGDGTSLLCRLTASCKEGIWSSIDTVRPESAINIITALVWLPISMQYFRTSYKTH